MEKKRLLSLDILRGITVAGMLLVNNPGSWSHIYAPLEHAEWNGFTPTDLVFPFFMFIMGISTFLSLRKYDFRLDSRSLRKVLVRAVVIYLIGAFVGWFSRFTYYWTHPSPEMSFSENLWESVCVFGSMRILGVLARLAICYFFASLIALTVRHRHIPWIIAGLLVGYWVLLALGNGFEYGEGNILAKVDQAVLGLDHIYNDNGLDPEGVLSTIPAVAHVLLGFCVGRVMCWGSLSEEGSPSLNDKIISLSVMGISLTFAGLLLSYGCPINKKVWSPTFVLTTCGLASLSLALLIWIIDVKGHSKWCRFFETYGVNALLMYTVGSIVAVLLSRIHFGGKNIVGLLYGLFEPVFGPKGGSLVYALLFVGLIWLLGYPLYKRKIYIKI